MLRIIALNVFLAGFAAAQANPATTATVRGLIRDPGRNPLPSVTVVLGPDISSKSPGTFTGYAITGPDGRFEIPNVPPGNYAVCPQVANSDYLNPCIWGVKPPALNVTPAGVAAPPDLDLALDRGTSLYVQVDDPHGFLKKDPNHPGLAIGVKAPSGASVHAYPPIKGPNGHVYRVIVPFGIAYTPVLDSGRYRVDHGAPGQRLASPFDKLTDSKIGEAPKVLRLSIREVGQ